MAQVVNLRPTLPSLRRSSTPSLSSSQFRFSTSLHQNQNPNWLALQLKLNSRGKYTCLFSNNKREEQARKALEGALGGKKNEFEKWDKEIQKREEMGGGGDGDGGGWFGWFGGSDDEHFWQEAQQASLAILGIIFLYLLIAKGEVMLAVLFNPLLFALRGTRNGLTFITSRILRKISPGGPFDNPDSMPKEEVYSQLSAKERVIRKWGSE